MATFQETATVSPTDDGFLAVGIHRAYDDGVEYRSVLYFQRTDAAKVADAVERFIQVQLEETVALADGSVNLFPPERGNMINLELTRDDDLPHGGYDTLDFAPTSAPAVIRGLRQHA